MVRELGMLIDTLLHEEICCLLGASDFESNEWYWNGVECRLERRRRDGTVMGGVEIVRSIN